VAVDRLGRVFVSDFGNHRVQMFAADGAYRSQWGGAGSEPGQFAGPQGIAVDGAGRVYVADMGNHRIQQFVPEE
jgi:DNA-binding beta-propeller fold protein YncE